MSERIKVSLNFKRRRNSAVVERSGAVDKGMDGNPAFPTPPVPLPDLRTNTATLSALMVEAADGSKRAIAARDKQREIVIGMLRQLASYVEFVSKGNMAVFVSSGFEAVAPRTAVQSMADPKIENIDQGNTGQLLVTVTSLPEARHYELHSAELVNGVPGPWTMQLLLKTRPAVAVNGLTPGRIYAFQVRALGPFGFTDWSDYATRMCT